MALDIDEFLRAVQRDRDALSRSAPPLGMTACKGCGVPLQETITGSRPCSDGIYCSDCYFDAIGEELDRHPISALRVSRGT